MTLAPIRGAPPGAPNPDFPIEQPKVEAAQSTEVPVSVDNPLLPMKRQRGSPIEIVGDGYVVTFRVVPELPAIMRASMTVHISEVEPSSSHTLGFLRMLAANARAFLTDLRNGRSPIVALGDEDGTGQMKFEFNDSEPTFLIHKPGGPCTMRRCIIERTFDIRLMAGELLADLGTSQASVYRNGSTTGSNTNRNWLSYPASWQVTPWISCPLSRTSRADRHNRGLKLGR